MSVSRQPADFSSMEPGPSPETPPDPHLAAFSDRVRIVLVRPIQSGNVGACARAMKNMGLWDLAQVAPQTHRKQMAAWMAPGAVNILEESRIVHSLSQALSDCTLVVGTTARGRRLRWPVHDPPSLASLVLDHPGRTALLFGPEDSGLDNSSLLYCHALATIHTDRAHSLNLAQAVLVFAHHIFEEARRRGYRPPARARQTRRGSRQVPAAPRNQPQGPGGRPASVTETAEVARKVVDLLSRTSYLAGRSPDKVQLTIHQILQRASASRRETEILLGMIAKLCYELDKPGHST